MATSIRRTGTFLLVAAAVAVIPACSGGGKVDLSPSSGPSSAPSGQISPDGQFLTYSNEGKGFSIGYPPDWEQTEDVEGTVVLFKSPAESATDAVRESVGVTTEDLPSSSITLEEYTTAALGQVGDVIPNFDLISSEETTLSGQPAHKIVYTGLQDQIALQWQQVFTVSGPTAFILTFVSTPQSYDLFAPTAESIFDTFRLL
jgi:hypothetical protein